jgi:hypothetical protein
MEHDDAVPKCAEIPQSERQGHCGSDQGGFPQRLRGGLPGQPLRPEQRPRQKNQEKVLLDGDQ